METLDKASHYAHDTFDTIANATNQAVDVLAEKSEDLLNAERQLMKNTRHVVRDSPLTSLAIAAIAGFLLSRILALGR